MSLVDHTYRDRVIKPSSLEQLELLQQLKFKLHPKSFEKLVSIVDKAIDSTTQNEGNKISLPWACAGSLLGHGSNQPHKDIEYAWEKVIEIVGPDKYCKMAIGALLQWRIAKRAEDKNEPWHAYKTEYDDFDPDTGKRITRYEYWMK